MLLYKRCYMCNRSFSCTHNYFNQHAYVKCKGCLNRVNLRICQNIGEEEFNNTGRYNTGVINNQYYNPQYTDTSVVHVKKEKGKYRVKKRKIINDSKKCSCCLLNDQNTAFIPCGHLCCCHECAIKCNKICPICRQQSYLIQKIYFS
jgi:hypothetical protein